MMTLNASRSAQHLPRNRLHLTPAQGEQFGEMTTNMAICDKTQKRL
jgi:hypothetical protein